ncbi:MULTISPECIES: helix-turn-helix transcriptional regulator [unclassified Pseudoalteromonas]|uniref:helix-turn-helix transcriptional regulator n=1 Tax=unclassified Pseudoalteromonas TaxID=194690 RepID=UPI002097B0B7|nr:helix-turn-helix transcriptional regulator [Pseudoalteromonas sp. XMcav2-N]MCO7189961.1 helix-turn-helix transcriptional regulator [Pseudoalteromonas sp. XMcav2-N]
MFTLVILSLGCLHGLYLSYELIRKNTANDANRMLALCIQCFVALLFFILLDESGAFYYVPHLIGFQEPVTFLLAPCFYYYVRRLTSPAYLPFVRTHLLPFFIAVLCATPFYLLDAQSKWQFLYGDMYAPDLPVWYLSWYENVFIFGAMIQVAIYLFLSWRRLNTYQIVSENNFSSLELINLNWLKRLLLMLGSLYGLWFLDEAIEVNAMACIDHGTGIGCHYDWLIGERVFFFSELGVVIVFYLMSYYGLRQPEIFIQSNQYLVLDKSETDKYVNSALSETLAAELCRLIEHQVQDEKLFLNPDLTLHDLACASGHSRHHVSQAINQSKKVSFFDFINQLRVTHAQAQLLAHPNRSVLDVSLDSGFNSRSAFYGAFKRYTGVTPGEYRKQHKQLSEKLS